ncbi:MAG TPA: cobyric acid synthase [Dongiaceae bacterium]|jgi:adenosylcobyric acid synthase|nr:cobyric acid synthase [Dongiaceae bacterium]
MFQGTGSDVGKSLIVAGLCRAFTRRGRRVRPFKPQNMSNNAAVTADGGEIGRAQALQARACGVAPSVHMNPVLLKPQSDVGAQVIVQGRIFGNARAADYHRLKPQLIEKVLESYRILGADADLILVEGAGSPAEVNLRAGDIANMGFAIAADLPVILIGDIDRGGVIASLVGTKALLADDEAARVKGFLINKFRGDLALFDDGVKAIARRTGFASLGVVPWFDRAGDLPAEDGVALDGAHHGYAARDGAAIRVVVPHLPRISNFDDLDPLRAEPGVSVEFVAEGRALPGDADLVVLPGSKATIADLAALRANGWDIDLRAHLRRGGRVLGLCGGYQMLGNAVTDPDGIEGETAAIEGLGFLDVTTRLTADKTLIETKGTDRRTGAPVRGYEMHVGRTEGADCARPMLDLSGRADGAVSADGRVMGCYLHGIFASDEFRGAFLRALRPDHRSTLAFDAQVDATLDALAAHLERHVDLPRIWEIASAR